jgi:hypothetical protein
MLSSMYTHYPLAYTTTFCWCSHGLVSWHFDQLGGVPPLVVLQEYYQ